MCGIAGFAVFGALREDDARNTLRAMNDRLSHRGPDGEGAFVDADAGLALGHRRLAIIDLSPSGQQPMSSPSGRFTIVFNGEIYGFQSVRAELEACDVSFRGTSDTEVLLAAIETWGVAAALERLAGMYAFALYDRRTRRLTLARDRLGKKPLYVGLSGGVLAFASELKALRAHPSFARMEMDPRALSLYFRHGFIPSPHSIYRNVIKLPPSSHVDLDLTGDPPDAAQLLAMCQQVWDLRDSAVDGLQHIAPDREKALAGLQDTLLQATAERMVADVPVGAFLSGGIDSTLVTALMQQVSGSPVVSFTVRFEEAEVNEADFAARIAEHLGTEHHEVSATPEMALALMDSLPEVYDEPFADPSMVPTLLVSQLARQKLTVVLSGDGGDESFGGYLRYLRMLQIERIATKIPPRAARALRAAPVGLVDAALGIAKPLIPSKLRAEASADRVLKLAEILQHETLAQRYDASLTQWCPHELGHAEVAGSGAYVFGDNPKDLTPLNHMMLADSRVYLPDDVLVKVDRASMAVGLEVRAPLLDYRVVEEAWRLPPFLRCDGRRGKVALFDLVARMVPVDLIDRPKQGFGIPVNAWLRGPLRDHCEAFFGDSPTSSALDMLDRRVLSRRWAEHLSGRRNFGAHFWTLLMFGLWHERWMAD